MGFQPEVDALLEMNGERYSIGEHPGAAGIPYGQEGRQGIVYLLYSEDRRQKKAMKVFRTKFVNPMTVYYASQMAQFARIPGLGACSRSVITSENAALLSKEPDLLYAVVMPWIEGPTWMDVLISEEMLSKEQSYVIALAFVKSLAAMEQHGLAHCDLSGPNIILPMMNDQFEIVNTDASTQFIDLEQMYSTQLERPEYVPAGSPGYGFPRLNEASMWCANADRFAGAVLLGEMLASCTDTFVSQVWGESYYAPGELGTNCDRYQAMKESLRMAWGEELTSLFVRAWGSHDLSQCPTFGEWLIALSKMEQLILGKAQPEVAVRQPEIESEQGTLNASLLRHAKDFEAQGMLQDAMAVYRSLLALNAQSSVAKELEMAIHMLKMKLQRAATTREKSSMKRQDWSDSTSVSPTRRGKWIVWTCIVAILAGLAGYGIRIIQPGASAKDQITAELKQQAVEFAKIKQQHRQEMDVMEATVQELKARVKELNKPYAAKRADLIKQLNEDYEKLKRASKSEPGKRTKGEQKTFDASKTYMEHLLQFVARTYNLDQPFMKQAHIVGGYYFPYMYNADRNSQLNIQFLKDYKDKFQ
ncbi:serine/threonine-protein kinase [Paenibacillus popilliae]|uniref:Protein kinase domain-containing protein n=1 Tax=Paenibacillus popilliae TaxID=78057 RepID=A0ABY3ANM4_PAEPP|nr:serine/threonine-protein kinase [Paenibacillus sp. SDF0028]TQR44225.1 hypothetical protein C7Y44_13780 [Paenibacillus sp. SDF0028]